MAFRSTPTIFFSIPALSEALGCPSGRSTSRLWHPLALGEHRQMRMPRCSPCCPYSRQGKETGLLASLEAVQGGFWGGCGGQSVAAGAGRGCRQAPPPAWAPTLAISRSRPGTSMACWDLEGALQAGHRLRVPLVQGRSRGGMAAAGMEALTKSVVCEFPLHQLQPPVSWLSAQCTLWGSCAASLLPPWVKKVCTCVFAAEEQLHCNFIHPMVACSCVRILEVCLRWTLISFLWTLSFVCW